MLILGKEAANHVADAICMHLPLFTKQFSLQNATCQQSFQNCWHNESWRYGMNKNLMPTPKTPDKHSPDRSLSNKSSSKDKNRQPSRPQRLDWVSQPTGARRGTEDDPE